MLPAPTTMLAAEQRGLHRDASAPQRRVQMGAVEGRVEGLEAEPGEQARGRVGVGRRRPDDRTEAARIGQAQRAAGGDEIEVVVRAGRRRRRRESERPRHARGAAAGRPGRARARGTCRAASPRRRVRATSDAGSQPSGQRSGLPTRTAVTRAPRMRSAKLRRVTSTSGSSGMARAKGSGDRRGDCRQARELSRPRAIGPPGGVIGTARPPRPSPTPH